MEYALSQFMESILYFFLGGFVGFLVGWFAHHNFNKKPEKKKARSRRISDRSVFGYMVMFGWFVAVLAAVFNEFEIPIWLHIMAGMIIAPLFDPDGRVLDRVINLGK